LQIAFAAVVGLPPVTRAQSFCESFAGATIDTSKFEIGGARRGLGGYGSGSWQWSHDQTDGALRIHLWGPATGGAYQGEAWVRTRQDFNDGLDHIVNFVWGADVNACHLDAYAIQICNGEVPTNAGYDWFYNDAVGIRNLYVMHSELPGQPECQAGVRIGQTDLAPTRWSIAINALSQTATLYGGPNLTGAVLAQKALDRSQPWHLRFIQGDGTSMSRPEGNNYLFLYDYCSVTASPPICDDFAGATIDGSKFEIGGGRRGLGGYGSGSWQWSHDQTDGALRIHLWGPATGGAYQGEAWVRAQQDFNDGLDHVVEFMWSADVNACHLDAYAIQICNGEVPTNAGYDWFYNDAVGIRNLYVMHSELPGQPECQAGVRIGQTDLAPTRWSIAINALTQTATLYGGPNLTGAVLGQKTLDGSQPWYLRFIQGDGTSMNRPEGNNDLFLHAYCSMTVGTPAAPAILAQPQSISTTVGMPASFTVQASGSPTPTYQWFLNGSPLPGATGLVLSLPSVQLTNGGAYTVVASNAWGTATSDPADLVVMGFDIVVRLSISGPVGAKYRVDYRSALTEGQWGSLTNLTLQATAMEFVDWTMLGEPQRFYRAVKP
jgi:hypothetical protein